MSGEGEREGKVVCVTGGSGYIASWLVKELLQRGYTVKTTVRDPNGPKTEFLRALDGAKERLQLFKANLLEEGSFDSAVHGCAGVFHTASPVAFSSNDPQADLIDPAVKGTLNVLRSCAKMHSIKRVVLTSSVAAIVHNGTPTTPDLKWYPLSKTLAEEAAWKFAKENGIDLVTVHPGIVLGPLLQPILHFGAEQILNLINGSETLPGPFRYVDIRDVVYAHIRALEVPTASGRYLLVGSIAQPSDVLKFLRDYNPTLLLPEKVVDNHYGPTCKVSQERAKSLGIKFMHWEVGVEDIVESLKEKGFLNI